MEISGGSMVSVIIPALNEAACLGTLLDVLAAEPGCPEVIVADGGSTDGTREIARAAGAAVVETTRCRGAQMNAGARIARGGVLLFLHADSIPDPGAVSELPFLLASRGAGFGAFRIRFEPPLWLPSLLASLTRLARPWTCFGDQGIFVRREYFLRVGGFPETALLEDVHWLRKAARAGRMIRSPRRVVTSARRFQKSGTLRQSLRNLEILLRERMGDDLRRLAALYEGRPGPAKASLLSELWRAWPPV